jgi:iron complex transport system substrate-binding protein
LIRFGIRFTLSPEIPLRPLPSWPVCPEAVDELGRLVRETERQGPGADERIRARFVVLLGCFLDLLDWSRLGLASRGQKLPLPDVIEQFLLDNLHDQITLGDIALVANLSVPTLTRRYRTQTGCSVMDRLLALRMEEGRRLLVETVLPVKEIAARVGFASASYFCRTFRQRHQCTASTYRSVHRGTG